MRFPCVGTRDLPRYALKRVRKNQGKIPVEVKRTWAKGKTAGERIEHDTGS